MAGTLTIEGLAAGLLTGEKIIGPETMTGSAVVGQITDQTLASGDNTLPVPSGAAAVLIILPLANTAALKIRSNLDASDGGLPIGLTGFVVLPIASGTTSLVVNAASAAGAIEATFI